MASYVRAGALHFDDGECKGTYGGVASGEVGGGRLLGGFNVQGRYNPKQKRSVRFEEPGGDFVNREDQTDVRDGTDYSANASYTRDIGNGRLSLSGLYVMTDRTQTEHSIEYNTPTGNSRDNLLSVNEQVVEIDQDTLTFAADYKFDMLGGRTDLDFGYSDFKDETVDTEEQTEYDDEETPPAFDASEGTRILTDTDDSELTFSFSHERDLSASSKIEFGVDYTAKDREVDLRTSEVEGEEEGEPLPPYAEFERARSAIEERRVDPYLMFSGSRGGIAWEAGLRYETTEVDVECRRRGRFERLRHAVAVRAPQVGRHRQRPHQLFGGRTVRRPDFNFVLPLTLEEEFEDNDFVGNPALDPETAWGIDIGYERRLGRRGIVGVNVFYRDVKDLIEVVNTGAPSATALGDFEDEVEDFLDDNPGATPATPGYPVFDPDSFVYTARNVGDGHVYGIEFDVSTPLSALGSARHRRVRQLFVARQHGRRCVRRTPLQWPGALRLQRRLHPGPAVARRRLRRQLSPPGRCLRPPARRGSGDELRRGPRGVRRKAFRRQLLGAADRIEPAQRLEGRGVQQVRQRSGSARSRFRRVRTGDRRGWPGVSADRAVFVLNQVNSLPAARGRST